MGLVGAADMDTELRVAEARARSLHLPAALCSDLNVDMVGGRRLSDRQAQMRKSMVVAWMCHRMRRCGT